MKSIIVALDKRNGIGSEDQRLWEQELPSDFRRFHMLTVGGAVILGRKTFDAMGGVPFPGRKTIIVSHHFKVIDGVTVARDLREAFAEAGTLDVSVIGGASIFEQALDMVDRLYVTEVAAEFSHADAFFPYIDPLEWREARREHNKADGANRYDFDFVVYDRKK